MRKPDIYISEVVPYVEKRIQYVFGIACEAKQSINEWLPHDELMKFLQKEPERRKPGIILLTKLKEKNLL